MAEISLAAPSAPPPLELPLGLYSAEIVFIPLCVFCMTWWSNTHGVGLVIERLRVRLSAVSLSRFCASVIK